MVAQEPFSPDRARGHQHGDAALLVAGRYRLCCVRTSCPGVENMPGRRSYVALGT